MLQFQLAVEDIFCENLKSHLLSRRILLNNMDNKSQTFFCKHLQQFCVCQFSTLINFQSVVRKIEAVKTDGRDRPAQGSEVKVDACGEVELKEAFHTEAEGVEDSV